jgi:hypothetical protein
MNKIIEVISYIASGSAYARENFIPYAPHYRGMDIF